VRTFIAIELEDELKNYIFEKQQIIKSDSEKGNFARKENFHLTLRFIGETNPDQVEALKEAIDKTSQQFTFFDLKSGKMGYFPKKNKKIIWLGISEGQITLQQLFSELENNLHKQGFKKDERGLNPHITLGRQIILKKDFNKIAEEINILYRDIPVKKISLMESTRINDILTYRPTYTKILEK